MNPDAQAPPKSQWEWNIEDIQGDGLWLTMTDNDGRKFVLCDLPNTVALDMMAGKNALADLNAQQLPFEVPA